MIELNENRRNSFPLSQLRVVDLTNVIAGPVATRVLGQLGAQIIKVEPPWGRSIGGVALFNEVNRAKMSIAIDLSHESGQEAFLRLVSLSDVVIENYSPRVMPNLGLSYDELREVRPGLIMVSMPAMGASGPWTNYVSFGPGTDAVAGLSDITGYEGGPPHKPGNFYADPNAAFHVATALMAALWQRRRTGRGQLMEIVLRETTMAVIGEYFLEYQLTGSEPQRTGNRHPRMAPHNIYRCQGDDAWIAIAVASDEEWRRLCKAMGDPGWCRDDRFDTVQGRRRHQDDLDCRIQSWSGRRTNYEAMDILQSNGVKAGAVLKAPEILDDPHYRERGYIDHTEHPEAGSLKHPGLPWRSSRASHNLGQRAPLFPEHSDWVLGDLLTLEESEIAQMRLNATAPLEPTEQ